MNVFRAPAHPKMVLIRTTNAVSFEDLMRSAAGSDKMARSGQNIAGRDARSTTFRSRTAWAHFDEEIPLAHHTCQVARWKL